MAGVYRRSARRKAQGQGDLVTVRTYPDAISAEADRAHLESAGITAHVFNGMEFNPAAAAAGAIRLQVAEGDVEEALEIVEAIAPEEAEADTEAEGAIRCPRCELAYCAFEKPSLRNAPIGVAFFALPFLAVFGERRWHCLKCGHVWDDPKEGPLHITKLLEGDPRPAFRLRRTYSGMGLFLGFVVGLLAFLVFKGDVGLFACLGAMISGLLLGRAFHHEVCSVPECRAPLPRDAEACLKCKGGVAGVIETAPEHYAAAADFRRELAALRERDTKKKLKKKKKASALP